MWYKLFSTKEARTNRYMLNHECFYIGKLVEGDEVKAVSVLRWTERGIFLCEEMYPQVTATHYLQPISK